MRRQRISATDFRVHTRNGRYEGRTRSDFFYLV